MSRVLVLDDDYDRHVTFRALLLGHDIICCYTAEQAIDSLEKSPQFDLACLDHDLNSAQAAGIGDHESCGMDVAEHIIAMAPERRPKRVIVHSWNVDRAMKMAYLLHKAGVQVSRIPFSSASTMDLGRR